MALCYPVFMDLQFKYRGRRIDDDDVAFINQLIKPIFRKKNKKNNDCKWLSIGFL